MKNGQFVQALQRMLLALGVTLAFAAGDAHTANTSLAQANPGPHSRIIQPIDNSKLVKLRGNVHPFARPQFDQGAVPGSQAMNRITLLLQRSPAQEAALEQLMAQQLDKSSPNYHKWLTPAEFGAQFGPSDADIQKISDWLTTQGFTNIKVSTGKLVVQFDGNAGLVQAAFHTPIHNYFVHGKNHFANVSDPEIPAALSPVVAGIVSLNSFRRKPFIHVFGTVQRNAKTGAVHPLFTFSDTNGTFYAVGPADFAKIYSIPSTSTGSGQSIAIVGRSNINIQDVCDFRSIFGLPACQPGINPEIILNGPDPGLVSGDETESDLDVQWAGAVAPGATIIFVPTLTDNTDTLDGVDGSALYIVDNNIAPILSDSYGSCEANMGTSGNGFYNSLWQQAAAEGITVSVAAGDNGPAGCDPPASNASELAATQGIGVSGLASTPYDVAMGGTDFDQAGSQGTYWNTTDTTTTPPVPASAKGYIPEIPWNDSCAAAGLTGCANVTSTSTSLNFAAGSGGPSANYAKPSWQTGITGMPNDSHRDLPDLALFSSDGAASDSFYILCESDADIAGDTGCNLTSRSNNAPYHDFQAVGGTSAAAPGFAGIMALVDQSTGSRQGNANLTLYALAKSETFSGCNSSTITLPNSCVFNDVTKGNNSVACAAGSPDCSNTAASGYGVMTTAAGGNTLAYAAGTGYDLATGLGSVNVANLLTNWAAPTLTGTSTTFSLSSTSLTVDASVGVSCSVTSGSGTPTGVVVLEDASTTPPTPIESFALGGGSCPGGSATTLLPAGSYSVVAHYGGDSTFGPSSSTPVAVNVAKQNSQIKVQWVSFNSSGGVTGISTSSQNVPYGSSYVLRIDVANASGTTCENTSTGAVSFVCPTGTVSLFDNGSSMPLNDFPNVNGTPNPTNVANLNDRGYVEDQPIQLNAGTHNITASYSAAANSSYNSQASSNTLSVTITKAPTTASVTSNTTLITAGGSVTLTAVVNSNSNSAQGPTGTVQFQSNSSNLGSAATCTPTAATSSAGASCTATLTTTLSALPPDPFGAPRSPGVPLYLVYLAALCSLICLWVATRLPRRRRAFACLGLIFFIALAGGISGCSGPKNGSGGGGSNTRSITGNYSGDSNYASSTSPATTITVQ
jgi:Pro-kumamolisin, activation domain/Bacterial Ig-like domain (group 3)